MTKLTPTEIEQCLDVLMHSEPHQAQSVWRRAFDLLAGDLWRARRIRRYCAIPAAIVAALAVVFLHGERWDLRDVGNLFCFEAIALGVAHLSVARLFAVLDREETVASALRYFGAHNLPLEEPFLGSS
jgi:hypothetical protein